MDIEVIAPVDVRIMQNWNPVIDQALYLIKKAKSTHSEKIDYGNSTLYHIGLLGCVSQHKISNNWHVLVGPWTKKHLPWLDKMMLDMTDLEPIYGISILDGDAAEHIDFPNMPTAFNYPVFTTASETYVKHNNTEYCYPGIADQPWILNTQCLHGVRNNEFRVVFNLHFGKTFKEVKQWFTDHPNLVYSG